jgi:methionine-S-sulfoxide reductase
MNQLKVPPRRSFATRVATYTFVLFLAGTLSSPLVCAQDGMAPASPKEAVATLAGGCFWCTEAVFERMKGVNEVVSGYIGGSVPSPTYEQVSAKRTGHAEAVEVYYDPSIVSYEEILEVFFKTHDPTTPNRQGNDYGPQYRSGVFYHNEEQKLATEKYIAKLQADREFRGKIVTEVTKASRFWEAEDYHQDYYRKNPAAGYCRAVVSKKVQKFNHLFEDKKK